MPAAHGPSVREVATFAAGCFWNVEEAFRRVKGVADVTVGYTGGTVPDPTYERVCGGKTGHAEAARVVYDSSQVTYAELMRTFWSVHDPTSVNRQGPDVGAQYRSVIFFHTPEQEELAKASKEALEKSGKFQAPIATEIVPAGPFTRAEEYHQRYLEKRRS